MCSHSSHVQARDTSVTSMACCLRHLGLPEQAIRTIALSSLRGYALCRMCSHIECVLNGVTRAGDPNHCPVFPAGVCIMQNVFSYRMCSHIECVLNGVTRAVYRNGCPVLSVSVCLCLFLIFTIPCLRCVCVCVSISPVCCPSVAYVLLMCC
jgi:hypothetical protein